jgi:uncharacterized membrane protein
MTITPVTGLNPTAMTSTSPFGPVQASIVTTNGGSSLTGTLANGNTAPINNGSNAPTSTFKLGDRINYVAQITNTTSSAATVNVIVAVTPPGAKTGIVSGTASQQVPAGSAVDFSVGTTIPVNARLGSYQVTVTAIANNLRAQSSTTYQVQAC